jgi:ubiquinol-cytochrome c reductase subunit 6
LIEEPTAAASPTWLLPTLCLQACAERVEKDTSGEAHCTGQYFDYWHCVDKCAAPKLFAQLK